MEPQSRYRRHDTAADLLPEPVRRRLDRILRRTVVVLDGDRAALRELPTLAPRGWDVLGFTQTSEALVAIAERRPVAVMVNARIPEGDGIGFLTQVAEVRPHVRRVLTSDRRDRRDFVRAINEAGLYRFVAKPWSTDALHDVLEGAYAQRRRELAVELLVDDVRARNTQLESARRALEEREAHLLHTERLAVLGRLTDGLAAGIRPLLEELGAVVERLNRVIEDPDDAELLSLGHQAVGAVWDIVDDINRFSRDGALDLSPEPTDLGDLVRRATRFAALDRLLKRRRLVVEVADDVPPLRVDPRRLNQVLLNLLRNAAEATEEDDAVHVTLCRDGDSAILTVRDEGLGIPPEVADRVFEEFFSTKGEDGLGLGLALCRRIVRHHGGEISCRSAPGEGTTFVIDLPIANLAE
ncbi:MAG: sensor histidine kinase [Myxococcota bacterium]